MKKIVSCLILTMMPVFALAALDENKVENAIVRAQAARQTGKPALSAQKQQAFAKYLTDAEYVMRQDDIEYLNPAQLGEALVSSVSRMMRIDKEARTGEDAVSLSDEEQRAVYYAIYSLLPAKNRVGMWTFEQYSKAYPVKDWNAFNEAAQEALELVYQAVADIANQKENYRYTWLWLLTH